MKKTILVLIFSLLFSYSWAGEEAPTPFWGENRIDWVGYKEGLSQAKAQKKPILLIFHAQWCAACENYVKFFSDEDILEASRNFIMIAVDIDHFPGVNAAYNFDGAYVPRTFALFPDGKVMDQLYPRKNKHRYFLEMNKKPLLHLMNRGSELVRREAF